MAIDNKIKRAVDKEWATFFPALHVLKPRKIFKILGHALVGIGIDSNGDMYGASFFIKPLYGNVLGIDIASVVRGFAAFYTTQGSCISYIPEAGEDTTWDKQCLKDAIGVLLEGDVTHSTFLEVIDNVLIKESVISSVIARLHSLKLFTALYVGDHSLAQQLCSEMTAESVKWERHDLAFLYGHADGPFGKEAKHPIYFGSRHPFIQGATFEEWKDNMQKVIEDPTFFFKLIKQNKNDPLLRKLQRSEILLG